MVLLIMKLFVLHVTPKITIELGISALIHDCRFCLKLNSGTPKYQEILHRYIKKY